MYGYKILRPRLRHTCKQKHSPSTFGHVILWVIAIILQTGTQRWGTTWSENDANTSVLLIRPWTMWQLQSTHQYIKTCIYFSFTGDKIQRNLLRQTNTGVKHSDVSETNCAPIFRVIPLKMGAQLVSENFVIFLNFDAGGCPRRLHWATKLVF